MMANIFGVKPASLMLSSIRFQVAGGSDNHNCVVCGADEVMPESCFNPNKWICEKATKKFPSVKMDLLD